MSPQPTPNSSSGEGRLFAILAYIIPVFGGIVGLMLNRQNTLTRNHAQQTIGAILLLVVGFITWGISAYIAALAPAVRSTIVTLTLVLAGVGLLAFLYFLGALDSENKMKSKRIQRLVWVVIIYGLFGGIYFLSQTNPDIVAFAVPVIELLLPVAELFMPVLLLATVIFLGGGIIPKPLQRLLSMMVAINLLTWMPLAGPVIAVSVYGLFIGLFIFLMANWGFGLLRALQGKERTIPLANQITARIFSDAEKLKAAPVRA